MNQNLIDILTLDIPEKKLKEDGFLDITVQGYKENVISTIYSYFLDSNKCPEIASIFMSALKDLIYKKTNKELILQNYTSTTEVGTDNGNRIDILIDDKASKEAIIVENKIYHILNNDLLDYWSTIKYPAKSKVGILLTLNSVEIPTTVLGKFINVTHSEWLSEIKKIGLPTGLTVKQYVYLTDFIVNMESLSINKSMNEQTKFFFEHTHKVLKAIDLYKEAEGYIINQLKKVGEKVGWGCSGHANYARWIWDGKSDYYYTIVYEGLLTDSENSITIILEMYRHAVARVPKLKEYIKGNATYELLADSEMPNGKNIHFVKKDYNLEVHELENLGDFIFDAIQKDFNPIMNDVIRFFKSEPVNSE